MHIGCGFHEVDARAMYKVCLCVHPGRPPWESTLGRTNEARDENETKPRESHVLQRPRLHALNCFCLLQSCLILFGVNHNTQEIFIGNVDKQKKQPKEEAEQNKKIHRKTTLKTTEDTSSYGLRKAFGVVICS